MSARLLAPGAFDSVVATMSGKALAFTVDDARVGRMWDLSSACAVGAAIPDVPDDWSQRAFGVDPASGGPFVAWARHDRLRVHHFTGPATVLECPLEPELVGLASHRGAAAVVVVLGPVHDAEIIVLDALTGRRRTAFRAMLGQWAAIDRWIVQLGGALIGVTCDTERLADDGVDAVDEYYLAILDVELGREVGRFPSWGPRQPAIALGSGGAFVVQNDVRGPVVRGPAGELVAELRTATLPDQVAAASAADRIVVAANVPGDPGVILAWDAAKPSVSQRVALPAALNDLAVATDGTIVAATDAGLYAAALTA